MILVVVQVIMDRRTSLGIMPEVRSINAAVCIEKKTAGSFIFHVNRKATIVCKVGVPSFWDALKRQDFRITSSPTLSNRFN